MAHFQPLCVQPLPCSWTFLRCISDFASYCLWPWKKIQTARVAPGLPSCSAHLDGHFAPPAPTLLQFPDHAMLHHAHCLEHSPLFILQDPAQMPPPPGSPPSPQGWVHARSMLPWVSSLLAPTTSLSSPIKHKPLRGSHGILCIPVPGYRSWQVVASQ